MLQRVTLKRGNRDEAEKPFWISFADLMTALMVLFLVSLSVALLRAQDETAKAKQAQERAEQAQKELEKAKAELERREKERDTRREQRLADISSCHADLDHLIAEFNGSAVEITPGFDGAPERWLEFFDKTPSVPEHFNIPTTAGAVHVALSEPVRSVLSEIKRLPGRRAVGAWAEAFMLNPLAALGEHAAEAIDPDQFAQARKSAGIEFDQFRPFVDRDAVGHPAQVGLKIDTPHGDTVEHAFATDDELRTFVANLEQRLRDGLQLLAWQEFEFELDGDAAIHLATLKSALEERGKPPIIVRHESVFDLASYSERVVGIGKAQPFISAYIVKKSDEEGWFGSNLLALLTLRPPGADEDMTLPLTAETLPGVKQAIEVEAAVAAFEKALTTQLSETPIERQQAQKARPTLLIKGNINAVEHRETREERLARGSGSMERPSALREDVELRQHQVAGIARMQHLFKASPEHCRGVLLADDMGLGKTLQLLTFIAWAHECDPALPPALIVAPVSLLDNWQEEIARFFELGSLRMMTAYGDALASLRVPRASVDADLQQQGLVRFLRPNWRGSAQLVLTTYETLRDLEFSFAKEPWSILVCDEAQKIKNPNALVTRAVKKLHVRFRIACTGTPARTV